MYRRKASIQNILRSLKKPTKFDEIIEAIPKPEGAVPSFGLPRWKVMSLDAKLPLIPAPNGAYYFSRKKVGQELFVDSRKDAEFNLNDPYNYDIDYSYDPLHDEHLANYFAKKNIMKRIIEYGFVTENLDVICNVKKYNMYRKYLKKLWGDSIKKELRRQAQIREDGRALEMSEKKAAKDLIRMKIREEKIAAKNKVYHELKRAENEKRRKIEENAARAKERLKIIELNKKENIHQIVLNAKIHAENVKRKRAINRDRERQKIINILLNIARRERKRRKMKKDRIFQETEHKRKMKEKKWQLKCQFQEIQLANEQYVLQYAKEERNKFINNYEKRVANERKRIKEIIEKSSKFNNCYAARHA